MIIPKPVLLVASYNSSADIVCLKNVKDYLDVLVINQYSEESKKIEEQRGIKVYNTNSRGLSVNRNIGLSLTAGRFVVISDDDIMFNDHDMKTLLSDIENLSNEFDFITFNNSHPSGPLLSSRDHDYFSIFKIPSWCILLNPSVTSSNIRFDERFGINSKYNSGEENIFLFDLMCSGFKGKHVNLAPVSHTDISTGFVWNTLLARTKGAMFRRTFGGISGFCLLVLFMLKKLPSYIGKPALFLLSLYEYVKFSKV